MLRDRIYQNDPYQGIELRPLKLNGWNSRHPKLGELIREIQPKLIVEVGTWMGASALYMSEHTDAEILCIDTWLGSPEMWGNQADPERYQSLDIQAGYPTIFRQFQSNVVHHGKAHQITPFPVPSNIGLSLLNEWGIKPDLIYIDGDHTEAAVKQDISLSAQLFPRIICGDDFGSWHGVTAAVKKWFPDANSDNGFWYVDRQNRVTSAAIE